MTLKDRLDAYLDLTLERFAGQCIGISYAEFLERTAKEEAARADLESYVEGLEKCRQFAQEIFEISDWPECGDIDGYDLQQVAEQCGLLIATTPTESCCADCRCQENNSEEDLKAGNVTCYQKTEVLKGAGRS